MDGVPPQHHGLRDGPPSAPADGGPSADVRALAEQVQTRAMEQAMQAMAAARQAWHEHDTKMRLARGCAEPGDRDTLGHRQDLTVFRAAVTSAAAKMPSSCGSGADVKLRRRALASLSKASCDGSLSRSLAASLAGPRSQVGCQVVAPPFELASAARSAFEKALDDGSLDAAVVAECESHRKKAQVRDVQQHLQGLLVQSFPSASRPLQVDADGLTAAPPPVPKNLVVAALTSPGASPEVAREQGTDSSLLQVERQQRLLQALSLLERRAGYLSVVTEDQQSQIAQRQRDIVSMEYQLRVARAEARQLGQACEEVQHKVKTAEAAREQLLVKRRALVDQLAAVAASAAGQHHQVSVLPPASAPVARLHGDHAGMAQENAAAGIAEAAFHADVASAAPQRWPVQSWGFAPVSPMMGPLMPKQLDFPSRPQSGRQAEKLPPLDDARGGHAMLRAPGVVVPQTR